MAQRSGVRPSLPFVYSLFVYVTRIRKITVALLTVVLLSNPVAAATLGAAPIAANKGQDLRYEFYSGGLAKSLGFDLTSTAQGSGKGWDGKGAPRRNRPAQARAESSTEREARVAQIKIFPGDVEINTGEPVVFAAVGLDSDGNAIGGLDVKWEARHEDEGRNIAMRQGSFSSPVPGKFIVTAETAGRREQVRVTVKGNSVLPKGKSESEIKIDSRELRRKQQISRLAPAQGDEKRLIAGKSATGKQLRASSKSMARVPRMVLLPQDQDPTGWNEETLPTFSNVGAERGDASGRAPSAGVGSGNFQITAPGVSLDGRGIDINLPFHYNSRIWHKSGNTMYFDIDRDTLVAGWNIGFGKIVATGNQYMLIDGDGTRHEFAGITNISGDIQTFWGYATDGTFIDYAAHGYIPGRGPTDGRNIYNGYAYFPDGTMVLYSAAGNYAIYPTQITDAHGNYITITYRNNQGPQIETITDTRGRVIRFHYDGGNLLTAITVPGFNGGPERQVVRLAYRDLTLSEAGSNYGFSGVSTVVRQNTIPVLLGIYYPATGNGYWFGDPDSYSRYGMIRKVSERRGMTFSGGLNEQGIMGPGEQTRVQVYSNPSSPGYSDIFGSLSDTPTYTQMVEDWWARGNGVPSPVTYFSVEDSGATRKTTVTRPDGVRQVQITDTNPSSGSYALMVENIVYPASGDTPLARSRTYFETGAYSSPRPTRSEAFDERGQMTVTTFGYGSRFNAPTDMREYGYSGQLLKRVHTEYLNIDNYNGFPTSYGGWHGRHIFNLPSVAEVYAGDDSTRVSRVESEYDGASLEDTPGVAHHSIIYNPRATEYDPTTAYRGNLTQVRRYADAASLDGGSAVAETFTYDITGNLRVQSTSCCEQTTFNYTTNTQYAWAESMVRGSSGDPAAQNTTSAIYDFNTGLVLASYDANGRPSNTFYNANSLRPEYEYSPTGAYVYHIYSDAGLYTNDIVYEANRDGSNFASRVDTQFDGRGQVIYEAAFGKDYVRDAVESVYDNLGRLWKRTRPFKEEANPQKQWAVSEYDSMDRPVRVTSPDGSVTQNFYNESSSPSAATSNAGQTVRSRDAWGRERWARLDEQNRLVEVVEPNPSGDGYVASGGMSTQFYYDTLGNLTQVNQGVQTRRFRYDSLGRLTHQKLAERDATLNVGGQWVGSGQWSDVFFYDQRSNLVRRVDARGVQTLFNFFNDPLNRLQEVVYDKSGTPANLSANIPEAPNVIYSYMTTPDGDKMRVREVNASNGIWNRSVEYDVEGWVSQVKQTFAGRESYPLYTNYLWDTLGRIKEVRYPQRYGAGEARKVVTHSYDIASRLNELKYDGTTMASNPVYNASDQITSLVVGGQITENYSFDPKTGLLLSQQVNKGPEQLLSLQYNYTLNNDPNNNGAKTGQLTSVTDLKNTGRNRAYEYDKLGRLSKVKGGVNAFTNPNWYQIHSYDRYGNRSLVQHTDLGMAPVKPGSQSRSDLIGNIGPGAGVSANRIFPADDPFAALGLNKGYGSITAGFLDIDNTGTLVRGGPWAPAEEYGNAPSANGAGGELLAEYPAGAAPSAPQKEYGNRRGLSIVTALSSSVVSPTAYQSPDPSQGGAAVNSPSNTGHGHTTQFYYEPQDRKTCVWHSFQGVSGQILSITLKFEWGALADARVEDVSEGEATALAKFDVEYSLNGGASWNYAGGVYASAWASEGGWDSQVDSNPHWSNLTPVSISIPPNTPISQIRVRSSLFASATGIAEFGASGVGNSFPENTKVQNIRLDVETDTTAPVISNVAAVGITTTGATITWTTNENSDSQVEYGTTQAYGQSTTLNPARVTAHSQGLSGLTPGTLYHYQVKSRDAGGNLAVSGDFTFKTLSGNAAAFVSQSVPATMAAGEAYPVTVTMLNQGITTWTPGQAYRLGSQNPQDNTTWMMTTNRVNLLPGDSVSPGATTTFSFVVTAPSSPGSYNFQWQMVQDGVEWFGAKTPNMAVQVVPYNDSAEFISQTAPSVMVPGAAYPVSITFRNTGNTTWTAANHYRLGSQNPQNNGTWGLGRVDLEAGELVPPGALKTFSFQVVAPSTPGSYNFQWQMLREGVQWFGAASTNLVVTLSPTDTTPPTGASFSPAAGATNVSPEGNVTVTFSEAMDAATVNGATVELRDPSNALVSATVSYDAASFTATLDPTVPLAAGVTYTARIKGGSTDPRVKDTAGNALAADMTWTFTIARSGLIPLDGLASLSYNSANNRINTSGFEYDPAGNQTRAVINASGTQQQYRYDCAGRLAQVLDANGTPLAIYSYGEGNQRLTSVEGGVTTYYAWAGGQIIAEYEASGANALMWKMSYVYMGGKLLATEQMDGIRYHHPDRLGTRLVTDASDGAVISEQLTMPFGTHIPYGSTLGGDNSWQHPGRSNLSKKKFTSYDRSDATGLDYAMNRFYSSQQGRFTQVDPIGMSAASLGNPQTLNLYAYCGNDPINNVDPDGLFWGGLWKALKAIGKAVANFFSAKIGGYSGPGFRTPPTFPGSTPSTISVSSGGNINARTPPFINGFQEPSLNSRGVLDGPYTITDSVQIRATLSFFEKLVYRMKRMAKGIKGLIGRLIVAPWQAGLAIGSGGTSLLGQSIGYAVLIAKELQQGDDIAIGGAVLTTTSSDGGETLKRLGTDPESTGRLARKAAEAEASKIGIYGVSVTAGEEDRGPHSSAPRSAVEEHFKVHDTRTDRDPLHRTVELPKPVTPEAAKTFNRLFGRIRR